MSDNYPEDVILEISKLRLSDSEKLGLMVSYAAQYVRSLPSPIQPPIHQDKKELISTVDALILNSSPMVGIEFMEQAEDQGILFRDPDSHGSSWMFTLNGRYYGEDLVDEGNLSLSEPMWYSGRFEAVLERIFSSN